MLQKAQHSTLFDEDQATIQSVEVLQPLQPLCLDPLKYYDGFRHCVWPRRSTSTASAVVFGGFVGLQWASPTGLTLSYYFADVSGCVWAYRSTSGG